MGGTTQYPYKNAGKHFVSLFQNAFTFMLTLCVIVAWVWNENNGEKKWLLGAGGWLIMMSGSSWQVKKDGECSSRIVDPSNLYSWQESSI